MVPLNYVRRCEPAEHLEEERKNTPGSSLDDFLGGGESGEGPGSAEEDAGPGAAREASGSVSVSKQPPAHPDVVVRALYDLELDGEDEDAGADHLHFKVGSLIRVLDDPEALQSVEWGGGDAF